MTKTDKKLKLFQDVLELFDTKVENGEIVSILKKEVTIAGLFIYIKSSLENIEKENHETNRP